MPVLPRRSFRSGRPRRRPSGPTAIALLTAILLAAWAAPPPAAASTARGAGRQQDEAPPGEPRQRQEDGEGPARLRLEEKVSVTASRLEAPLLETGSSVTVLDAAAIEATGARWLHEVLDMVPGVAAVRTAGPGSNTSLFLRGTNSNHTLVMIDGVKVNSPTTGGYDFGLLPVDRIDRVEVLRGPQSTLYGSEAIGGVIQIFTRRGEGEPSLRLEAEGGALSTGSGSAWVGGAGDEWSLSAGATYLESGGISAAAADRGATEEDGLEQVSFDASVAYEPSATLQVRAFVRGHDSDTEIDGYRFGFGPADDDNYTVATRQVDAGARVGLARGIWRGELTLGLSKLDAESSDPDGAFFLGSALDAWTGEIGLENELDLGDRHGLVAGAEIGRERAETVTSSPFGDSSFDETIDTLAVYVEDRIELAEGLHVSVGARHDDHELFGGATTFRAAVSGRLGDAVRLHGSAGSGFRAPSLNDLFFPGFANPDLDAEASVGWDAGVELYWRDADLRVDATWFDQRIDDLIQFSPASSRAENLGEATTRGVETTLQWAPAPRLRVDGSWTFTEAEEEATGLQLVRRPRHQGSVAATLWPSSALRLQARLLAKGRRADNGPAGRLQLDPYARVDLAARYRLGSGLELTGRLRNLLDAEYREVFGYGIPGRSAYVGIGWRLGPGR